MGNPKKYEHIRVSASDMDEKVILAGKRAVNPASHTPDVHEMPVDSAADKEQVSDVVMGADEGACPDDGSKHEEKGTSDYAPTTLADIEESKMSGVQIAVIVIAIIAVALFVIWYIFFSRSQA